MASNTGKGKCARFTRACRGHGRYSRSKVGSSKSNKGEFGLSYIIVFGLDPSSKHKSTHNWFYFI